mmetsp:Transcript_135252/g.235177  ORF Transcript_135252/g.235177 Transcript_135252/m.235177 type:complete len:251 (+) Transcript_135252:3357-4109(+)
MQPSSSSGGGCSSARICRAQAAEQWVSTTIAARAQHSSICTQRGPQASGVGTRRFLVSFTWVGQGPAASGNAQRFWEGTRRADRGVLSPRRLEGPLPISTHELFTVAAPLRPVVEESKLPESAEVARGCACRSIAVAAGICSSGCHGRCGQAERRSRHSSRRAVWRKGPRGGDVCRRQQRCKQCLSLVLCSRVAEEAKGSSSCSARHSGQTAVSQTLPESATLARRRKGWQAWDEEAPMVASCFQRSYGI